MPQCNDHSNCQASCSVCSAPAAIHLHYGAISCYSCRLHFFKLFQLFIHDYLFFHLLLFLQVTSFKLFQVFIWLFSAGPFSEEGFPNKSGGLLFNISMIFYPFTECEQCALGAYLGQGGARLLSRTEQTANSADIRCRIIFAKAM